MIRLALALALVFVLSIRPAGAFAPRPFELEQGPDGLQAVSEMLAAGQWNEAVEPARALLAETERTYGPDSIPTALVLDRLVEALYRAGHAADPETVTYVDRSLAILRRELGDDHVEVAFTLHLKGTLLQRRGDYPASIANHEAALDILARHHGDDHIELAGTRNDLAIAQSLYGDLLTATELLEANLALRLRDLPAGHRDIAESHANLGWIYMDRGMTRRSIHHTESALSIISEAEGPDHPMALGLRSNLAIAHMLEGDLEQAQRRLREATEGKERVLGLHHRDTAEAYVNESLLLSLAGRHAASLDRSRTAIQLLEGALTTDHPRIAIARTNHASILHEMGDSEAAIAQCDEARRICEAIGVTGIERSEVELVAGRIHFEMGNFAASQAAYASAAELIEGAGLVGPALVSLHIGQSRLAQQLGDLDESLAHVQAASRAAAIDERPRSLQALFIRTRLGEVQLARGDHAAAAATFEALVGDRTDMLSRRHPSVAATLAQLAMTHRPSNPAAAFDLAEEATGIIRDHRRTVTRSLAESQALRVSALTDPGRDLVLALAATALDDEDRIARAWDTVVQSRALVLDEMAARHRSLTNASSEIRALREADRAARARLANLVLLAPEVVGEDGHAETVRAARQEQELAERALIAGDAAAAPITLADVRSHRPAGWAVVAFAAYDDADRRQLLAFALSATDELTLVPLGDVDTIDAAVDRWRQTCASAPNPLTGAARAHQAARELAERIWDPIEPALAGADGVLLVPDGSLGLVDFSTLRDAEGRYLVERDVALHLLATERDVVRPSVPRHHGLFAIGGPTFDSVPETSADLAGLYRSASPDCGDVLDATFPPLPGASSEIHDLTELWRRAGEGETRVHLGPAASETAFKLDASGSAVVHVATHGFFVSPDCDGLARNPLTLSGLVMAGANARNDDALDDGFLTAEEIAAVDLSGTRWAVLSACESGLGTAHDAEGGLGLRRSFQVAGAETVIMSLWPVDDVRTRGWMHDLYRARLDGQSTADAVRSARLAALDRRRSAGLDDHPAYWAGFVASGNWR